MKWHGINNGRVNGDPGMDDVVVCGICKTDMGVERNVLGPTSFAEAIRHHEHLHDAFICPHYWEEWHKRVVELLNEGSQTKSRNIRKMIASEITEILATRKVPSDDE